MFVHTEETLVLSQACLQSLCASMNAPVVNIDELVVAPARAAIVFYAEEYGDLALALAIRSSETGQVALFRYRGRVKTVAAEGAAMQDALAFAEGMGFLFDENMLADDSAASREAAFEHWNRLVDAPGLAAGGRHAMDAGDIPPPGDDILPSVQELLEPAEELLPSTEAAAEPTLNGELRAGDRDLMLDDLVELGAEEDLSLELDEGESGADVPLEELAGTSLELTVAPPAQEEALPVEEPPAAGAVPLTKFRRPTADAAAPAGSQLGRIPIVRRKQGDPSKPSYLGRLLASF
jgi:hypothetical protein